MIWPDIGSRFATVKIVHRPEIHHKSSPPRIEPQRGEWMDHGDRNRASCPDLERRPSSPGLDHGLCVYSKLGRACCRRPLFLTVFLVFTSFLPGPCEPGVLPGTVRTVLAKPGVECSPDLPRVAASERERTHKSQTRRSAPTKVQPSHPRGGLDL